MFFNQRYFELSAHLELGSWLIVQDEVYPEKSRLLNTIAALKENMEIIFSMPLLLCQGSKNLDTLEQILNDYFPYCIEVSAKAYERRKLPVEDHVRIGNNKLINKPLGHNFLLGKTCSINFSNLVISIKPKNKREYLAIRKDNRILKELRQLAQYYLRDNTTIYIYLYLKRSYLSYPQLSSNKTIAARLGVMDCLAPERKKHGLVSILLS